jgi:Ca-activated chloride channel family protein
MAEDAPVNLLSFALPILLVLLVVLLPFAGWALQREHRSRDALAAFGDESLLKQSSVLPDPRRRIAGLSLKIFGLALAVAALARPQLGERPVALAQTGRDLLVLLDLSRSMNAAAADAGGGGADLKSGSRLAVAKQAISEVLNSAQDYRVGLIVFGGSAFLQLPLTSNRAAFQRYLDAASTDDLGDPGTNLSSALAAAATVFEHDGERGYQSILLVSDGETGPGDLTPPLARLRRARIPVVAIGVGGPDGAPVPADSSEAPERWHRDHIGRIVVSRLQEAELRLAAKETGGGYARWTPEAASMVEDQLGRMEKRTVSSQEGVELVDRFQWPLGLAVLALALEPVIGGTRRRRRR